MSSTQEELQLPFSMFVQAQYCDTCGDVRPCKCDAVDIDTETRAERAEYEPEEFEGDE
jgi:hypothetical protein